MVQVLSKQKDKSELPKEQNVYENVLSSAWARLLMYDNASTAQKNRYQFTRRWVILLWFTASCIAIIKTVFQFNTLLEGILQLLLVVISAISVAVMGWGIKFANNVAWIEYRTSAEKIRSQIYLFRTGSGEYYGQTEEQQRDRLLAAMNESDRRIPEGIGLPPHLLLPHDLRVQERLSKKTKDKDSAMSSTDEFLQPMSVDEYIKSRLESQITWYTDRVLKDSGNMERFQMLVLAVAGLGTVLGAVGHGLEAFIVLTTAGGIALSMWGNIRMFGATGFIYRQTANDLQDELDRWNGLETVNRTPEAQRQFIEITEKLFLRETEEWRKYSIHMQIANEQTLLSNIQVSGVKLPPVSGSEEAVNAAKQELGDFPATSPRDVTPAPAIDGVSGVEPRDNPILETGIVPSPEEVADPIVP